MLRIFIIFLSDGRRFKHKIILISKIILFALMLCIKKKQERLYVKILNGLMSTT